VGVFIFGVLARGNPLEKSLSQQMPSSSMTPQSRQVRRKGGRALKTGGRKHVITKRLRKVYRLRSQFVGKQLRKKGVDSTGRGGWVSIRNGD